MSVTRAHRYDHPTHTIQRDDGRSIQIAALGVLLGAQFRTKLRALVTNISVILASAGTVTQVLTLLFNGSVAAILTLGATANQNPADFTLTSNYDMATLADRFEISSGAATTGQIYVVYQYRIIAQDVTYFGTNTI